MHISDAFDAGNIRVVDASDPSNIQLEIKHDAGNEHLQWFFFRVSGAKDTPCTFRIVNAGKTSYPKAWSGFRTVVSTDREHWGRVADTSYADGVLTWQHTPEADQAYYAYFAPYSHERHLDLIAEASQSPRVQADVLGTTLDGRDLERLVVGTPGEGKRTLWVIGRQHPGESMAEWWMEGFLARLLDESDPLARKLLDKAVVHVVPNMNPDGSVRGHLRTNACGANLNREWHEPTLDRAPEVKVVRDAMDTTGVDLCLDVHGDEELPYNFVSGAEGIPGWTETQASNQATFLDVYERANPDFQQVYGYGLDKPGAANLTMCTNQVAKRFDCLAMTLEMPFKDNANAPDADVGWSPGRCRALGASALDPIMAVLGSLR